MNWEESKTHISSGLNSSQYTLIHFEYEYERLSTNTNQTSGLTVSFLKDLSISIPGNQLWVADTLGADEPSVHIYLLGENFPLEMKAFMEKSAYW